MAELMISWTNPILQQLHDSPSTPARAIRRETAQAIGIAGVSPSNRLAFVPG
jgi:hypothetical protein